jgi:hypothetical protein
MGSPEASPGPDVLAPGDPRRPVVGRAVLGAILLSGAFTVCAYIAKEARPLYVHSPWEDDPYDAVVSFTVFFVPMVASLCLLRLPACRRDQPLPVRRAADLLRAGRVAFAAIALTLVSDWASVALRANRPAWSPATALLVVALAVLTGAAAVGGANLHRAARLIGAASTTAAGTGRPDWVDDLLGIAGQCSAWLGPARGTVDRMLGWLGRRPVPLLRRHRVATAAVAAAGFGVALAAGGYAGEGPGPGIWLLFVVGFCGMYAFCASAGAYLRIVSSERPASGIRRQLIDASVLACASVPVAIAFRGSLLRVIRPAPIHGALPKVMLLLLAAAVVVFAVTLIAEALAGAHMKTAS